MCTSLPSDPTYVYPERKRKAIEWDGLPPLTFGKSDESQGLGGFLRLGVKGVARRDHEAAFIPWPGRAMALRNVDCGMRIEKENHKIRNPQFEIRN